MEFDFSKALEVLRRGGRVARRPWVNVMAIFLVDGSNFQVNRAPLNKFYAEGTAISYHPHIDAVYPDSSVGVWTPTVNDILSEDWYELTT